MKNIRLEKGYKVELYDSFEKSNFNIILDAYNTLRKINSQYTPCIASNPIYLKIKAENFKNAVGPFVLILKKEDAPVAMLLGLIENLQIDIKIGFTIFRPNRKCLIIPEGGILISTNKEKYHQALLNEALNCFSFNNFSAIRFLWLPVDSVFYSQAVKKVPWKLKDYYTFIDKHWYTDLPASVDELLAKKSGKQRYNIKRQARIIENNNDFHIEYFTKVSEVSRFMDDADTVAFSTYQRKWGVGFHNEQSMVKILEEAAQLNNLLGLVLYDGEKPCAYQIGITTEGIHYVVHIGHDPDYEKISPGIYLLLKGFEYVINAGDVSIVDYGWSDGPHKHKFGTRFDWETNVVFFSPTLYNFFICIGVLLTRTLAANLRKIVIYFNFYNSWEKLKRGKYLAGK